jgi:hypothetical protein
MFSPKLLFAVVEIADRLHVALLDTGASINVVPEDLAQDILATDEFRIKGVSGPPITVNQKASIKFVLGGHDFFIEAFIIPSMSYEMILGAPFFRKYNTILDFQRKQLRIPPFSVPIYETVEAEAEELSQSLQNGLMRRYSIWR